MHTGDAGARTWSGTAYRPQARGKGSNSMSTKQHDADASGEELARIGQHQTEAVAARFTVIPGPGRRRDLDRAGGRARIADGDRGGNRGSYPLPATGPEGPGGGAGRGADAKEILTTTQRCTWACTDPGNFLAPTLRRRFWPWPSALYARMNRTATCSAWKPSPNGTGGAFRSYCVCTGRAALPPHPAGTQVLRAASTGSHWRSWRGRRAAGSSA